jgi:hypothetical protein
MHYIAILVRIGPDLSVNELSINGHEFRHVLSKILVFTKVRLAIIVIVD